jgi:RNA polymerase sigma-70 factor (ECF subfamily)
MTSDELDLVARSRNGDVDAFCLLASHHQRRVYLMALRFSCNHHDAEDLSQEVFLKAFLAIKEFNGRSTFLTWLRRIMVNAFLNHSRRKEPEGREEFHDTALEPVTRVETAAVNKLDAQRLFRFLKHVPHRQRLMFIMKYDEGLTAEEIAEYFGTTAGTVKKTIFRIVEQMREEFQQKEEYGARLSKLS